MYVNHVLLLVVLNLCIYICCFYLASVAATSVSLFLSIASLAFLLTWAAWVIKFPPKGLGHPSTKVSASYQFLWVGSSGYIFINSLTMGGRV